MKLRKARKAPKRFDDYEWEEEEEDHEARVTTTSPKPRAYSAMHLRPHTLPYNPNLPPAAFPTLEYGVPREANSVATESESPHAKSLVLNTKIQSHIKWLRNNKTIGQKVEPAKIPVPPSYTTPLDVQPDSMYDKLSRMTAQRETAEIIYHQQQRGNEVYARNMEILDRMAKRTDDDWNIQEMMTSDEEDASPVTCNQTKESTLARTPTPTGIASAASWDTLSTTHQLDLVHTMFEIYGNITEAMQQLRLNTLQSQRMLNLIERCPESEVDETTHISALETEKIKMMLFSDLDEDDRKHSRWANPEKLTLSTFRELAKAKAYLESCGEKPTLLDHWKSLLYDHGSSCGKNCRKLVSSLLIPAEAEKARSCLTIPAERPKLEHISRPCEEVPSQKPLFQASNSPITFPYPISPDSSSPPRKFAKSEGQTKARHPYPAAEHRSAMLSSHRAFSSRHQNLSSASSNFISATSSVSSTDSNLEPSNPRDCRSGSRTAAKDKSTAGERRKRVVLGLSSECVDPKRRLLGKGMHQG